MRFVGTADLNQALDDLDLHDGDKVLRFLTYELLQHTSYYKI